MEDYNYDETIGTFDAVDSGDTTLIEDTGSEIPTADSTPEEVSAFYARLGAPGNSEGYDLQRPEDLPEGLDFDEDLITVACETAARVHLTQDQMQAMFKCFNDHMISQYRSDEAEFFRTREEGERKLREDLGAEYEEFTKSAKRVYRQFGDENLFAMINDTELGNSPPLIKFMGRIAMELKKLGQTGDGDDYETRYPNSPSMYEKGEDAESEKARQHFRRKAAHKAGLKSAQEIAASGGYVPAYPNSPEQYAHGEDEESKRARAYFTGRGHKYRTIIR